MLPLHWRSWIDENKGGKLTIDDFGFTNVNITFEDDSIMRMQYAFFAVDEARKELAVFTEHCGYYVLPINSVKMYKLTKRRR